MLCSKSEQPSSSFRLDHVHGHRWEITTQQDHIVAARNRRSYSWKLRFPRRKIAGELTESNHNEGSRKEAILMLGGEGAIYRIIRRNRGIFLFLVSPLLSYSLHLLVPRWNDHLSETSARVSTNGIRESERKASTRMTTLRHSSPEFAAFLSKSPPDFDELFALSSESRLSTRGTIGSDFAHRGFSFFYTILPGRIGKGSRRAENSERGWEQLISRDTARFCTKRPGLRVVFTTNFLINFELTVLFFRTETLK